MKTFFTLLLWGSCFFADAQKLLQGVVIDADKKTPVPGASVFLSNTSIGTTANEKGAFELSVPNGRYDLIVSSIGYETYNYSLATAEINGSLTIALHPKAKEMENVVVEPYDKNGWEKWGRFFTEMFIGSSSYAAECKLKNPQVLQFRNNKKTNELTASSFEPLVIENKALGYQVRYQLEGFSYNFSSHFLYYEGYPLFIPMKGSKAKEKRWRSRREEVYYGSILHFMRSVYRNKIIEEGFEVHHLKKVQNTEKARVKAVYASNHQQGGKSGPLRISADSSEYYSTILRQPDAYDIMDKQVLCGDSIAGALDRVTAELSFNNYLLITYKKKMALPEYSRLFPDNGSSITSQITLLHNRSVLISANGSYYSPTDLLYLGYWSWSEKMSTMLPFDYEVPKK